MDKIWITYILLCKNNKLYVGVTNDLEKRLLQHKGLINGGAKYTRANPAIDFVYQESRKKNYFLFYKQFIACCILIEEVVGEFSTCNPILFVE